MYVYHSHSQTVGHNLNIAASLINYKLERIFLLLFTASRNEHQDLY
jgi:hypothetical protein